MMAAVQVDYNGYGKRYFGSGNGDNEYGKKYPVERIGIQVFIERYKVDVYTIQHEFNAHEHGNHIASCKQPVHAYKKQACTNE
jgi:hypothetical protein